MVSPFDNTPVRNKVVAALQELCAEAPGPERILFTIRFSAKDVAERAGVSTGTARAYLDALSTCRGFSRRKCANGRALGYHYDAAAAAR